MPINAYLAAIGFPLTIAYTLLKACIKMSLTTNISDHKNKKDVC